MLACVQSMNTTDNISSVLAPSLFELHHVSREIADNHFAFLHFFFLGMVLITVSYTMSRTSIHPPWKD